MILVKGFGRLGNRLRLFAHVVALACDTSQVVINPSFREYGGYFPSMDGDPWCRFPARSRSRLRRSKLGDVSEEHFQIGEVKGGVIVVSLPAGKRYRLDTRTTRRLLKKNELVIYDGFVFYHSRIDKHREEIVSFFTPHQHHLDAASKVVDRMRDQTPIVVGVHIRRRDYAEYLGGAFFFEVDEYLAPLRHMQSLFKERVGFVVCADEPVDRALLAEFPVSFGTGNEIEDLHALAKCDFVIGPPSTYTEWASYYGGVPKFPLRNPGATFSLKDFVLYEDLRFKGGGFQPVRKKPNAASR
jgi:hypothetical protein